MKQDFYERVARVSEAVHDFQQASQKGGVVRGIFKGLSTYFKKRNNK